LLAVVPRVAVCMDMAKSPEAQAIAYSVQAVFGVAIRVYAARPAVV